MSALALALHLVLAAPGPGLPAALAPRLDPGPFQSRELVASSLGVLAGDALVVGGAYYTLQLFANGTLRPSADNFRSFAYGLGVAALVVPPLTSVLLARWFRAEPASGAVWKALLLSVLGQGVALAVGYYATPNFWVVPAVQMIAVGAGATVGLHWGRGGAPETATFTLPAQGEKAHPTALPLPARRNSDPAALPLPAQRGGRRGGGLSAETPLCPDPALAAPAAAG